MTDFPRFLTQKALWVGPGATLDHLEPSPRDVIPGAGTPRVLKAATSQAWGGQGEATVQKDIKTSTCHEMEPIG